MLIINIFKTYFIRYKIYFQSASLYFFASLFSASLRILINPLIARNLSYNDYAIIGYFNSFGTLFLPMLSFMITSYYLRNYYLIPEEKKERTLNTIIISLLGIGSISSVIVLMGFFAYLKFANISFPFWPFALLIVLQIVFNNFLVLLQINYRIKRDAKKFAKLTVFSSLLWATIAILLVVVLKTGAIGSMGAKLLAAFLIGIYCFKKMITKFEFDFSIFKEAINFSWPLMLSAILWYFLSGIDRVFLEKLNDIKLFALYNIGLTLSGFFAMFYTTMSQTFEPDIYKSVADNKIGKLLKIIFGIITINAIPILIFILFATPLTSFLTGGRYAEAAGFASILSLKNITMSMYYSVITVIVGFGYTKAELGLRALGSLICIIMYKLLIANFSFYGAAWGQVLSFLLMAILGTVFIYYKFRFRKLQVKNSTHL